jgi:hypothetical protein
MKNTTPAKLSCSLNREMKTSQDKDKLKQFMSTNPTIQKILQGLFHIEEGEKKLQI